VAYSQVTRCGHRDSVGDPVTSDNARELGSIDLPISHAFSSGLQGGSVGLGQTEGDGVPVVAGGRVRTCSLVKS